MRTFLILLFFIFFGSAISQVITTDPPFATVNDSIVIIFDATKGDQGLMGYTGKVYTHTGATINGTRWQNVIGSWGEDTGINAQPELSKIGTDLYKLVISKPHSFYSVNPSDKITELSFVFRSAGSDGPTGRDVGGADVFLELFKPGLTLTLNEPFIDVSFGDPRRSPVFTDGELTIQSIAVTIGTKISTHKLYQNDILIADETSDTLDYVYTPMYESGMQVFKITGADTSGLKDSIEFAVMITQESVIESRPEGVVDGINYIDANTVILSLFAPYKEHVFLIGDFNDWFVDEKYQLKKDTGNPTNIHWWIRLDSLTAQMEYAFQYLVNGEIRVADPYSEKILHKHDSGISGATYPNLKPYPEGKTDFAVSVLETGQEEYVWEVPSFERPPKEELVIYELLVRDFVATHDYKTLTDTLDYLENLGINAIELMPVNEFENNESWGYNPSFHMALDKYYGPPEDLKKFIDECHKRGIAVIFDAVLNHAFGQSPLVRLYATGAWGPPSAENPWLNIEATHPFNVGYDFNHESKFTQDWVDQINAYWLNEFNIDGYRFDLTKGFMQTGDFYDYNASRIALLKRMADELWKVDSTAYITFEHLGDNTEEKELADHGIMLWGHPGGTNPDIGYYEATMGYHDGGKSDFSLGYFKTRGWAKPHLIAKIESHDEERLMYKNLQHGNSSGDYNVKDLSTALQRMKAAAAFFFTIPGPKLFWQFMEVGYDISINQNGRTGNKPILWNYFQDPDRKKLYKTYAALLKLRKDVNVFRDPNSVVNLAVSVPAKRIKLSDGEINVSIIGNFDVVTKELNPDFHNTGTWYDFFTGDSIEVANATEPIALAPGEFHIYTDVKLETPDEDPVTFIKEVHQNNPQKFELGQNYPNPFNPLTAINYNLANASDVEITIFDIQGRRVKTLIDKNQNAGNYTVKFNATDLSSGTYFYTFRAGSFVQTRKMLLIK
ncbi:MAG: T9SS C-terminal target domain-containing protein [Calditrichaeota bacterium]|nr:MAG: T9SS C-terminal target domain-containing protein [Calditrichota bacterium]MBL1207101.1 T9SS C-terminal target domain-containing protein [Calditrichota bacterium]NOG46931.1 T9SS type A sorting domain-containing protein [Calditrichota bacterium]